MTAIVAVVVISVVAPKLVLLLIGMGALRRVDDWIFERIKIQSE
jgi:hypothetical protein